eukprot:gene2867-565_t
MNSAKRAKPCKERGRDDTRAIRQRAEDEPDMLVAWELLRRALESGLVQGNKNRSYVLSDQASLLRKMAKIEDAIEYFNGAITECPDNEEANSQRCYTMLFSARHDPLAVTWIHQKWGQWYSSKFQPQCEWPHSRDLNRTLRVGYVSSDVHEHAAHFFMDQLFTHHSNKYRVWVYANFDREKEDSYTRRVQECPNVTWEWIPQRKDQELVRLIRDEHQIDILVDCNGHTTDPDQLRIFAYKPAPIQLSYMGSEALHLYPHEIGLPSIDDRLEDLLLRKGLKVPFCWYPVNPLPGVVEFQPQQTVKIGSYSQVAKLNDEVIQVWARIIRECPQAILVLKHPDYATSEVKETFKAKFQQLGVSPDRLRICDRRLGHQVQLAFHYDTMYGLDIQLDPFPYSGHTTTCESLAMGVPVLTLDSKPYHSKVSTLILREVCLRELVATSTDEYVTKALGLARNPHQLAKYRKEIRGLMLQSQLCDYQCIQEATEDAYLSLWKRYCYNCDSHEVMDILEKKNDGAKVSYLCSFGEDAEKCWVEEEELKLHHSDMIAQFHEHPAQ